MNVRYTVGILVQLYIYNKNIIVIINITFFKDNWVVF